MFIKESTIRSNHDALETLKYMILYISALIQLLGLDIHEIMRLKFQF
jgi:hypothetical protein